MKPEPYKFWCSLCKKVHAGECPPKPVIPTVGSLWQDQYRRRDNGQWEVHPARAAIPLVVAYADLDKETASCELGEYGTFGFTLEAWTPDGALITKSDMDSYKLYDRWRVVPA